MHLGANPQLGLRLISLAVAAETVSSRAGHSVCQHESEGV
jgi:hypothetical protein